MATTTEIQLDVTLKVLLNELKEECSRCSRLIEKIQEKNLSGEEVEELLGELTASVTHLSSQSESIKVEIEE
ncbi:MAG: hypothetical protein HQK84_07530 [Nitrospinae bacterium]|nr:hypothetical protein [Nitrospinota bacterium]